MRYWAGALGAMVGFGIQMGVPGCNKNECIDVACDYTHVTVHIVTDSLDDDGNPEAGTASRVIYSVNPYNEDGEPMSEDELDESGFSTSPREASCANRNEDEGTCDTWVVGAGFGKYEITAFLCDEDDDDYEPPCGNDKSKTYFLGEVSGVVDLTVPTEDELAKVDEPQLSCCGSVHSDELELELVEP